MEGVIGLMNKGFSTFLQQASTASADADLSLSTSVV